MSHLPFPAINLKAIRITRGVLFGSLIMVALLAFEIFNYSTTDFALTDMLGDLRFLGIRWATILSIAFCGIDFAGIARIFTPEQGADEPAEVWYLFGAWLLAAAMNASLTWWGVSVAIRSHVSAGASVLGPGTVQKVVPIFVAVMIWVIRLLIIGTISIAGDRLFSQDATTKTRAQPRHRTVSNSSATPRPKSRPLAARSATPQPTRSYSAQPRPAVRPVNSGNTSPAEPQYVDDPYTMGF